MTRLRPRNWNEFQHYRRRSPPWVKLHKKLLDDYEFQNLPLASKALAPMLWLLASEDGQGWIDAEAAKISFRLRMTEGELNQAIQPLIDAGFFEREDASAALVLGLPDASPESESKKESEDRDMSADADFDEFWKAFDPPKNAKKPDAREAWRQTADKRPPWPALLRAVAAYNAWLAGEWRKNRREFPAKQHAATWLRAEMWDSYAGADVVALTPEQIEANKDRADRLLRRGKYAVSTP